MLRTPAEWVELGRDRVLEVLAEQHAVVRAELVARISEAGFRRSEIVNVDPTHVMTAADQLADEGVLAWSAEPTRGGRVIKTLQLAEQRASGSCGLGT